MGKGRIDGGSSMQRDEASTCGKGHECTLKSTWPLAEGDGALMPALAGSVCREIREDPDVHSGFAEEQEPALGEKVDKVVNGNPSAVQLQLSPGEGRGQVGHASTYTEKGHRLMDPSHIRRMAKMQMMINPRLY